MVEELFAFVGLNGSRESVVGNGLEKSFGCLGCGLVRQGVEYDETGECVDNDEEILVAIGCLRKGCGEVDL